MENTERAPGISAQSQIDAIIYLASLASRPEAVDVQLDRLRQVTAERGDIDFFTPEDQKTLHDIQLQLENYLVDKETLRGFTHESLTRRLAEHASGKEGKLAPILATIWAIALGVAGLAFVFSNQPTIADRLAASIPLVYVCIFAGSAWLCFTALNEFKQNLRKPYLIFSSGIGALGLSLLYTAVLTLLGHSDTNWEHLEVMILPFLPATAAIYIGMRSFAQALGIKSWVMSPSNIALVGVVGSLVAAVIPHGFKHAQELFFDITVVILWLVGLFIIAGSILMFRIARSVNNLYGAPMRWLLAGFVSIGITLQIFLIMRFELAGAPTGLLSLGLSLPLTIGGFLILKAATEFNKLSRY